MVYYMRRRKIFCKISCSTIWICELLTTTSDGQWCVRCIITVCVGRTNTVHHVYHIILPNVVTLPVVCALLFAVELSCVLFKPTHKTSSWRNINVITSSHSLNHHGSGCSVRSHPASTCLVEPSNFIPGLFNQLHVFYHDSSPRSV